MMSAPPYRRSRFAHALPEERSRLLKRYWQRFANALLPTMFCSWLHFAHPLKLESEARCASRSRSPLRGMVGKVNVDNDFVDSDYDEEKEDAQRRW